MRSAGVIGRSPRHGRPPLGFVTAGGFVTGFSAGGVMVRVPLMTPIGYGGGSSCSLSSRSQAAQCNIHQAFIIALLAMFHGVRAIRLSPIDGSRMYGRAGILAHPYMLGANGQSNGCV